MNSYLVLPIAQSIFAIVLISFVIRGHGRSPVHRLFSLYLLALAVWGGLIFAMRASPDAEHAYTWEKALTPVAPLLAVILYHFTIRFTKTRVPNWWLPSAYLVCLLFAAIAGTRLVFAGMQTKPFGYAPIPGPAMLPWGLFSYVVMILALFALFKSFRTSPSPAQRNRSAYIFIGVTISLLGGTFDVLTLLGFPLYPGAIIGNIAFCILTTVAIVRYNLLDIGIILRKSAAYLLLSAIVAAPFVGVFLVATSVLTHGTFPPWSYIIFLAALAFALPQLWRMVQQWVDRWFYRDRYDYLKALEIFSRDTQSVRHSAKLGSTVVNLLTGALQASSVYVLQPLTPGDDFTVTFSAGMNNPTFDVSLKRRSILVKWLERSNSILSAEDINIIPQLQSTTLKEKETLQQVGAKIIAPLKTRTSRLSGLLILGPKLSEQPYTIEDKQLIYTISNQVAIGLENARLYQETRRSEQALRESEEKLRLMFESINEGITVTDLDVNIVHVNEALIRLHGYDSKEELIRRSVFELIAERDQARAMGNLKKTLEEGYVKNLEYTFLRRDGGEFDGELRVAVIKDTSGNPTGFVTITEDVTERKQAEEREMQLQQQLNLSSRLASIGELAAGVAHEINNPLTGILGFSEILLDESTDERTRRNLERIHNETLRAAKVVENLLTFARPREPKKQYSDINDILQKALELRAYELKAINIEVTLELAPSLPKVMVDFSQIQQVLLNIILNAEQAMTEVHDGGKLSIKTEETKGYIRVCFTDDGSGIPAECLNKLFDPFFTTRREKGGTGLGLSVCHGIVARHSGRIYAKSKLGKGTTFVVELPLTTEKR